MQKRMEHWKEEQSAHHLDHFVHELTHHVDEHDQEVHGHAEVVSEPAIQAIHHEKRDHKRQTRDFDEIVDEKVAPSVKTGEPTVDREMYHRGVDQWATEHRYHDTPAFKPEEQDSTHFDAEPEGESVMHYEFLDKHAHGRDHHHMPHFDDSDLHHHYPMQPQS